MIDSRLLNIGLDVFPVKKQKNTRNLNFILKNTLVIRNVPTMDKLKQHFKQKGLPITNVTCIQNDKGPLPQVRLFTKNPNLVSYLITNGIFIGYCRYKVEKSRTMGRPVPYKICLQYHEENQCTNKRKCYKCGEQHQSYTCKVTPNKTYCGTCNKH